MTDEEQRAVDKAHGALGMAIRVAEAARESLLQAEARVERAREAVDSAEQVLADSVEAVALADAELNVRASDPLLAHTSSRGETIDAGAAPAQGTGGN